MKSIEDLQKMAKNGEISKKLLGNEEFKKEFKKVLSEDSGVDATDEQICGIIKKFESALQDEKNLNEAELQEISGGDDKSAPRKHSSVGKAIRFVTSCAGMAVGWEFGERTNAYVRNKIGNDRINLAHDNETPSAADVAIAMADTTLGYANRGGSIAGGIYLGYKAGDILCKWLKVDE